MWDAQIDKLAADFHIRRYDSRGHGLSDATAGAYSIDMLADDAIALLDGLGIDKAHLFGHHTGASIAVEIAARYADLSEELYDHTTDPYEFTNLANDQTMTATKRRLAAFLPKNEARPTTLSRKNKYKKKPESFDGLNFFCRVTDIKGYISSMRHDLVEDILTAGHTNVSSSKYLDTSQVTPLNKRINKRRT